MATAALSNPELPKVGARLQALRQGQGLPLRVVQLTIQPGGALESAAHEPGSREHLSVLSGSLEVSAAGTSQLLVAGETARYAVDGPHAIRHLSRADGSAPETVTAAVALLVVLHP